MVKKLEYFFTPQSAYAYLGHARLKAIAENANLQVDFKPIDIVKIFQSSTTTPPAAQSPARLKYRQNDLVRLAKYNGLPLKKEPKFWPTQANLAACCIIAAGNLGLDQWSLSNELMTGIIALDMMDSSPKTGEYLLLN